MQGNSQVCAFNGAPATGTLVKRVWKSAGASVALAVRMSVLGMTWVVLGVSWEWWVQDRK